MNDFTRNFMLLKKYLLLAVLLTKVGPVIAQPSDNLLNAEKPRPISMMEALQLALKNNLDIRISQTTPLLDQYGLNGLYGAYEPGYSFSSGYSFNSTFGGIDSQGRFFAANTSEAEIYSSGFAGVLPTGLSYNLGGTLYKQTINSTHPPIYSSSPGLTLRQPILKNFWIDGTRWQISLGKKSLKIDQLALRWQIMTVVNNVKAAYYNLIFARENVQVKIQAWELAKRLFDEDKKKVELGALAPLEEKQAESQVATSQANWLTAEQALAGVENNLRSLISDNYEEWANIAPIPTEPLLALPEPLDLQASLRRGIERRPDLAQAKLNVEKQNITLKYTRNQLFPELDLTGSYGHNATTIGLEQNMDTLGRGTFPYYSYGLTMTIPLGNRAARNNHKAAKESLNQLMLQLKKTERTIVVAIDNDVKLAADNFQRIKYTSAARVYAESALEGEQKKFDLGKSTSLDVLQSQNTLTSARSDEIRSLADYNISLEQLAYDEGSILERSHIDVNLK